MSRLNLADRLNSLRAVQKVWEAPHPEVLSKTTLRFPNFGHPSCADWIIDSGMLVRTLDHIPMNDKMGTRLDFISFRHILRGDTSPPHFGVALFDFDCVELGMDPEQQLLIALNDEG